MKNWNFLIVIVVLLLAQGCATTKAGSLMTVPPEVLAEASANSNASSEVGSHGQTGAVATNSVTAPLEEKVDPRIPAETMPESLRTATAPMAFTTVTQQGYWVKVCVPWVTFLSDPKLSGTLPVQTRDGERWITRDPTVIDGAKMFVLGTGDQWGGGKLAEEVEVSSALGNAVVGAVDKGVAYVHLPNLPRKDGSYKNYFQPLIFLLELKNGSRGWFVPGYPTGPYTVQNALGEYFVLVVIGNEGNAQGKILGPGKKGRELARQQF